MMKNNHILQTKPKVSVGMPVYNGELYLEEAINSVLKQTYENFELIIADNASTDNTQKICQQYILKDKRVRYYRNKQNIGAPGNYNKVFELSSGEYFRWANADDGADPELIQKCVSVLEENMDAVLCYGKTKLIDENGKIIKLYDDNLDLQDSKASDRYIRFHNSIGLTNVIYGLMRSSALEQTALMGKYLAADVNFMAELTLYGKFIEIPDYLFYRRIHPEALSWDRANTKKQLEFWNSKISKFQWQKLRKNCAYFTAVNRAPIAFREKCKIYAYLMRIVLYPCKKLLQSIFNQPFRQLSNRNAF